MKSFNYIVATRSPVLAGLALAMVLSACNSATPADSNVRNTNERSIPQVRNAALPRCTNCGRISGIDGLAGNEIEKRAKSTPYYRVTVAMENGGSRVVEVETLNGLSTGSRVRIVGNNLQALSS